VASIAYLSAEIGLSSDFRTYSGGLGVLSGDHMKAAADAGLDVVGVTLLYREGFARQQLDAHGVQTEVNPEYDVSTHTEDTGVEIQLPLDGDVLHCRIHRTVVRGGGGTEVDVFFLDTSHPKNSERHARLAARLYGGDDAVRIRQEYLLGVGGIRALRAMGRWPLAGIHLNEGHCAFATLEMLRQGWTREQLRRRCLFTTHTPIPVAHEKWPYDEATAVLGDVLPADIRSLAGQERLSMSHLAVALSGTVNAVSVINARVAAEMFPGTRIDPITNGVHHLTWTAPAMAELYDAYLSGWREDPGKLSGAESLPEAELYAARGGARAALRSLVRDRTGVDLNPDVLTIGFARRFTAYKRADLVFRNLDRLSGIAGGEVQFVFAGKAHPRDEAGKELIRSVFDAAAALRDRVTVVFVPDYSMAIGAAMTAGVDVWLNNPVRPLEASGTSGMKAAMNGAPNCSILDGWWPEACKHGVNGWSFGTDGAGRDDDADADALYRVIENDVLPAWHQRGERWANLMRASIAVSARFTAARMVADYRRAYESF
jgi:starch phosphorylase